MELPTHPVQPLLVTDWEFPSVNQGHKETMDSARRALEEGRNLGEVIHSLACHGIHPLSLLISPSLMERSDLLAQGDAPPSLTGSAETTRRGNNSLLVAGYRPPGWLSGRPSPLDIVGPFTPTEMAVMHSILVGRFLGRRFQGLHLNACAGELQLPRLVQRHLSLLNSQATIHFPPIFSSAFLEIRDCPGVHALPQRLYAHRVLIDRCPNLRSLPSYWGRATHLDICHVPAETISSPPATLKTLRLARLPNVERIPLPPSPQLDLEVQELPQLRELHAPGTHFRDVLISHCPKLESIPESMATCRNLTLMHLPSLRRPLGGIRVEGRLRIIGCPSLSVPPNAATQAFE